MDGRGGRAFREISWRERIAMSTRAFWCRADWRVSRDREGVRGNRYRDSAERCRQHAVTLPA